MRSSSRRQSPAKSSITRTMRGERTLHGVVRMRGNSTRKNSCPLPHRNAALQQEGADLIDDAGALADQSLSHPMQRLQVELIGSLRRHELHRWPLYCLSDRLRVVEVVLLSLRIGTHVLRRHQSGVVTKPLELATEMMRTDTGLHADQARWHVGKSCFHLAT